MIAAVVILAGVGVLFLILGWCLWQKQAIHLLHDYHREHVSEEHKKAFCALSGKGVVCIGLGIALTAVLLWLTESAWSFCVFGVAMAAGLFCLITAGLKYNRK